MRVLVLQDFADQQGQRAFRRLKFKAFVLQVFDPGKNGFEFGRIIGQGKAQFLSLHHDVAAAGQIADQHPPAVPDHGRVNVLKTPRNLLHRIHMHAALVREGSRSHPGLAGIVPEIGDLIDELRQLPQHASRRLPARIAVSF